MFLVRFHSSFGRSINISFRLLGARGHVICILFRFDLLFPLQPFTQKAEKERTQSYQCHRSSRRYTRDLLN